MCPEMVWRPECESATKALRSSVWVPDMGIFVISSSSNLDGERLVGEEPRVAFSTDDIACSLLDSLKRQTGWNVDSSQCGGSGTLLSVLQWPAYVGGRRQVL